MGLHTYHWYCCTLCNYCMWGCMTGHTLMILLFGSGCYACMATTQGYTKQPMQNQQLAPVRTDAISAFCNRRLESFCFLHTAGVSPEPHHMRALCAAAHARLPAFSAPDMSCLVHALATMQYRCVMSAKAKQVICALGSHA